MKKFQIAIYESETESHVNNNGSGHEAYISGIMFSILLFLPESERNNTTAYSDYKNPNQGQTVPNPLFVENVSTYLLRSMIFFMEFTTSNLQHFLWNM